MNRFPSGRRPFPLGAAAALAVAAALAMSACQAGSSAAPTVGADELMSEGVEGSGEGAVTNCVPPATVALLQQIGAPGADAQTLVKDNQDALLNGLAGFEPADTATETWRDALVEALESEDANAVATQAALVASGSITLPTC